MAKIKFVLDKKALERVLKIVGVPVSNAEKEKNIKVTIDPNGLWFRSSNSLTFVRSKLVVEYLDGTEPSEAVSFCLEGSRFIQAVMGMDGNERIYFEYQTDDTFLHIKNGFFAAPFMVEEVTQANFVEFDEYTIPMETFVPVIYPIKHFVKGLTFLRKFPDPTGSDSTIDLVQLKGKVFVGGRAGKVGFYFCDDIATAENVSIPSPTIPPLLTVLKHFENDTMNFNRSDKASGEQGEHKFCLLSSGDDLFGYKEWGSIKDTTLKKLTQFKPEQMIRGDKTWLQSILRKMAPFLEEKADIVRLIFSGSQSLGKLTVKGKVKGNEKIKDSGEACEYFNVYRDLGKEPFEIKMDYRKILEILDVLDTNNFTMEVDAKNIVKIQEDAEATKSVALLTTII